ncbi:MAG TPA: hypothetical protein VFJ58_15805 [Armatimonadota bacterium]|nr:hypothetical protein [Armatimonadota bacterium]
MNRAIVRGLGLVALVAAQAAAATAAGVPWSPNWAAAQAKARAAHKPLLVDFYTDR